MSLDISNLNFDSLAKKLQPYYQKSHNPERLVFTGHSHQRWPDSAFEVIGEYEQDTCELIDHKWGKAFAKTERLRSFLRDYFNDANGYYSLADNTHKLIVAFLSALDIKAGDVIVTTDSEFHSLSRQLMAFEQQGITIVRLAAHGDLEAGVQQALDKYQEKVKTVMMSHIFFNTGRRNSYLEDIAVLCDQQNIPFMIDDYHGTMVVPLSLADKLKNVYVLIGGYKYLQWGEGNCFIRYPKSCQLQPSITGWFASFSTLSEKTQSLSFDENQKFTGSTYDPFSQYRACQVLDFFEQQGLSKEVLAQNYAEQRQAFKALLVKSGLGKLLPCDEDESQGGFVSLTYGNAQQLEERLLEKGVWTDSRHDRIRFGFAPYVTLADMQKAIQITQEVLSA